MCSAPLAIRREGDFREEVSPPDPLQECHHSVLEKEGTITAIESQTGQNVQPSGQASRDQPSSSSQGTETLGNPISIEAMPSRAQISPTRPLQTPETDTISSARPRILGLVEYDASSSDEQAGDVRSLPPSHASESSAPIMGEETESERYIIPIQPDQNVWVYISEEQWEEVSLNGLSSGPDGKIYAQDFQHPIPLGWDYAIRLDLPLMREDGLAVYPHPSGGYYSYGTTEQGIIPTKYFQTVQDCHWSFIIFDATLSEGADDPGVAPLNDLEDILDEDLGPNLTQNPPGDPGNGGPIEDGFRFQNSLSQEERAASERAQLAVQHRSTLMPRNVLWGELYTLISWTKIGERRISPLHGGHQPG